LSSFLEFLEKEGGVDQVFGIHLWSLIPINKICVSPGARMANGDGFSIKVIGRGGHGSRPDQCIDPLKIWIVPYFSSFLVSRLIMKKACLSRISSFLNWERDIKERGGDQVRCNVKKACVYI